MVIFLFGRLISSILVKYMNSRVLLTAFAIGGMATITGVIFIQGMGGLYCWLQQRHLCR